MPSLCDSAGSVAVPASRSGNGSSSCTLLLPITVTYQRSPPPRWTGGGAVITCALAAPTRTLPRTVFCRASRIVTDASCQLANTTIFRSWLFVSRAVPIQPLCGLLPTPGINVVAHVLAAITSTAPCGPAGLAHVCSPTHTSPQPRTCGSGCASRCTRVNAVGVVPGVTISTCMYGCIEHQYLCAPGARAAIVR